MKALWLKIVLTGVYIMIAFNSLADGPMTRKEALVFAESSPEAQAIYALHNGKYVNCINKSVLRPCDTDWVTCIDDAWVVKFEISKDCRVSHDGRVDLVLLVDEAGRKIISRYPEKEYYLDPVYCQLNDDCLMLEDKTCYNFVYGQVAAGEQIKGHCQCGGGICQERND